MRTAWITVAAAVLIGVLAVTAAFALSDPATGNRDGTSKLNLQDTASVDPKVLLDLPDLEAAIERVADVRRTAASESRVAEDLKGVQVGESVRWELETTAYVEGLIFRDAATARAAAPKVAKIGGTGTTVIQVDNTLSLLPDLLVTGNQSAVSKALLALRTESPQEAAGASTPDQETAGR